MAFVRRTVSFPWIVVLASCLSACAVGRTERVEPAHEGAGKAVVTGAQPKVVIAGESVTPGPVAAPGEVERCRQEVARLEKLSTLPGDPELEARRGELFLRAKTHPVLLTRAPQVTGVTPEAEAVRNGIHGAEDPVKALFSAYPRLQKRRDLARQVLLTEGYLYSPRPFFAAVLSNIVKLEDIFGEEEIFLQRGEHVFRLRRREEGKGPGREIAYVHADGELAGRRVKVLLLDRVALTPAELAEPLHLDILPLSRELGFDSLRPIRLTAEGVVAEAKYGGDLVPTVLDVHGAKLSRRCEAVPEGREAAVAAARALSLRRSRVLDRLRAVMTTQVDENLPFDEPKTEFGQEDGKLRQHWGWAYRYGRSTFEYNEDRYRVFDGQGRPRVPQVCIDFIRDTFERAGGSWYRPRGEARERVAGAIDFSAMGIENERSVEHFVEFARARPEWFDVYDLTDDERFPYSRRTEFFSHLVSNGERYRPGDVIVIYGLRDDGKMHYHTFFVYESDLVTGAPSLVAANAGRPKIRPFEGEMLSAPGRSIRTRIRPRLEWLEYVTGATPDPTTPARAPVPDPTGGAGGAARPDTPI